MWSSWPRSISVRRTAILLCAGRVQALEGASASQLPAIAATSRRTYRKALFCAAGTFLRCQEQHKGGYLTLCVYDREASFLLAAPSETELRRF